MTTTAASNPIRVGIIGVGRWAKLGHMPILSLLREYKLSAIYSRSSDVAESAAADYGVPHVARTVDELASHPEVDLVVVLTTAPQHEEGVRAAVAAGKDVFCEWPLTPSIAATEKLVGLADAAGVRTTVGLHRRLTPHNQYLGDLLEEGYVGKLRSVRLHVSMNLFQASLPAALSWTAPPQNFSGMVALFAGHYLDMVFTATGWPDSFSALAINQFPKIRILETGEVIVPREFSGQTQSMSTWNPTLICRAWKCFAKQAPTHSTTRRAGSRCLAASALGSKPAATR